MSTTLAARLHRPASPPARQHRFDAEGKAGFQTLGQFRQGRAHRQLQEIPEAPPRLAEKPRQVLGQDGRGTDLVPHAGKKSASGSRRSRSGSSAAKLNASVNCLDRHLEGPLRNKAAIICEGEPGEVVTLTYQQLHREVCLLANVLKKHGVKAGDRVMIYLPMIPEAVIAMLACARIGAPHSVVFSGFSAEALKERINDCGAKVIITADGGFRRGSALAIKTQRRRGAARLPQGQERDRRPAHEAGSRR